MRPGPGSPGDDAAEIAGDERTGAQAAKVFGVRYESPSAEALGNVDLDFIFRWLLDTLTYWVDCAPTHAIIGSYSIPGLGGGSGASRFSRTTTKGVPRFATGG